MTEKNGLAGGPLLLGLGLDQGVEHETSQQCWMLWSVKVKQPGFPGSSPKMTIRLQPD
jgi:hypothetical protein